MKGVQAQGHTEFSRMSHSPVRVALPPGCARETSIQVALQLAKEWDDEQRAVAAEAADPQADEPEPPATLASEG